MTAAVSLPPVRLRPARPTDFAFVLDAWRRSFERTPIVNGADPAHYRLEMATLVGKLFKRASVRIAHAADDEDTIAGFAVYTGPELHYLYVRGGPPETSLRGMGIARLLTEDLALTSYTFRTAAFERRMRPKDRGWTFTPRFTL